MKAFEDADTRDTRNHWSTFYGRTWSKLMNFRGAQICLFADESWHESRPRIDGSIKRFMDLDNDLCHK